MTLKWDRGHPVFINPQAGLVVGALSLPTDPPHQVTKAERKLPCCCRLTVSRLQSTMGPNLPSSLGCNLLSFTPSIHLPPSVRHSQPRSARMTAHHAVHWHNGANKMAECRHFSCQTVLVCVLIKWQLIEGFMREGAVWMKGLCTDLIKTQCSNYCWFVCDKWTELDSAGRENTHRYLQIHISLNKGRASGIFTSKKRMLVELNLVPQCGVRHK